MIVFLVICFFVFSMIYVNSYLKKFYKYHISHDSYVKKTFIRQFPSNIIYDFSTSHKSLSKLQINENAYRQFCDNCCTATLFSLTMFGINAILHMIDYESYNLNFFVDALNCICFFLNLIYIFGILYFLFFKLKQMKMVYNFLIMLFAINNYFYFDIQMMYFNNFLIYLIPYLFKATFDIYEINYTGNDEIIKILDFYLNYL